MKRFSIFVIGILNDYSFLLLFTGTSAVLIISLWISFTMISSVFPNSALAHITGNRTQQRLSPQQKPLLDSPTELKFSVQYLQTGEHLKELLAKIMIINGQGFNEMTVQNGDFSVNSTFPNEGTYQVILRINSKGLCNRIGIFQGHCSVSTNWYRRSESDDSIDSSRSNNRNNWCYSRSNFSNNME